MTNIIAVVYNAMDERPLRASSLVLVIALAGRVFWDSSCFAAKTSELEIRHGFLLMWVVCAGIIHGVGFRSRAVHWQGTFCPPIVDIVLVVGLIFFFF